MRLGTRARSWQLGIALGVVLLSTAPFSGKAFHIDDVYFIEVAENVVKDPLRPFAGAVALEDIDYRVFSSGGRCPTTFSSMSHPPLVPYAIALVRVLANGFSERALHLAFLLFAAGACVATLSLARRFTAHPLAATLLIVSSPVFALSAESLATDMATLAFSLGAVALLVAGIDTGRRSQVLLAGLLAGLAGVTRYAALPLVLLLLFYGFGRGKLKRALPVLIGFSVVLGAWCVQNLICHGQLHIVASSRHYQLFYQGQSFDWPGLVKKTLGDLAGLGGTAFVAAVLLLVAGGWRRWIVACLAASGAIVVFIVHPRDIERLDTYSNVEIAALAFCFACGVLLVLEAFARSPDATAPADTRGLGRDRIFLLAWAGVTLAVALLLLPFGTARYVLPALPPLGLLLARSAESRWTRSRLLPLAFSAVIAQGLALGTLLSLADAEYAARSRAVALGIRASHPNRTIWYVGEWGFRYYMRTVGGRYLSSADDSPDTGDIIIRPFIAGMHEMSPNVRSRAVLLQDVQLQSRWPIRLMSFDAKAGYYSQHWGFLPWTFSHAALERFEIFEVRAPAPGTKAVTCASS